MEIARKVQVDVFHGDDLGVSAAGRAAFDAEAGSQGRFAQGDDGLLADLGEALGQADGRRGLAFAGRRRRNGRHQDQFARFVLADFVKQAVGQFGLVLTVHFQVIRRNAQFGRDVRDGKHFTLLRDFNVRKHGIPSVSFCSDTVSGNRSRSCFSLL